MAQSMQIVTKAMTKEDRTNENPDVDSDENFEFRALCAKVVGNNGSKLETTIIYKKTKSYISYQGEYVDLNFDGIIDTDQGDVIKLIDTVPSNCLTL